MLIFSQSVRAWLEFKRCTNAVLTMAGRPTPLGHWHLASQGRAHRRPGRCQKQLLTEIETYDFVVRVGIVGNDYFILEY